ncbi:MAG: PDZ domain-containing protein [Phycisphaerales bacterium]
MNAKLISMMGLVLVAAAGNTMACPPDSEGGETKVFRRNSPLTHLNGRVAPMGTFNTRVVPLTGGMGSEPVIAEFFAAEPEGRASDNAVYVVKNGDREVRVVLRDGKVESATQNGQAVPMKRVLTKNDRIIVKGDNDEDLAEFTVVQPDGNQSGLFTRAVPAGRAPLAITGRGGMAGSPFGSATPGPDDVVVEAVPPKSMIGITLAPGDEILSGHLGIKADEVTMISGVSEGLAADSAGLKPYDLIVEIAGKRPADPNAVREAIRLLDPGAKVTLRVIHKGAEREVTVTTEAFDAKKLQACRTNMIPDVRRGLADAGNKKIMISPGITMNPLGRDGELQMEQGLEKARKEIEMANRDFVQKNKVWRDQYTMKLEEAAKAKANADEMKELARTAPKNPIWMVPTPQANDEERMRRLEEALERLEKKLDEMNKRQEKARP